jgi:hypothetical protein
MTIFTKSRSATDGIKILEYFDCLQYRRIPKELWCIIGLVLFDILMRIWGSHDSLDSQFYYSAAEANSFFQSLDQGGARAYLRNEIFDFGFLATYSVLFLLLYRRFFQPYPRFSILALTPGVFDVIETTMICAVLTGCLNKPPIWLGFVTCLKWITAVAFLLITAFRWVIYQ